jgi:hypothetical protein
MNWFNKIPSLSRSELESRDLESRVCLVHVISLHFSKARRSGGLFLYQDECEAPGTV